jgi:hypothetical protein
VTGPAVLDRTVSLHLDKVKNFQFILYKSLIFFPDWPKRLEVTSIVDGRFL